MPVALVKNISVQQCSCHNSLIILLHLIQVLQAYNGSNFFKDTTLISLIDSALQNSYDLQLAVKRIEEAQAYVKQARANYIPTVDVSASATTSNPSNNSLNGKSLESFIGKNHLEDYTLSAAVSWDVYGHGVR